MNALLRLAAGPLFAFLVAATYRAVLWVLGGQPSESHVRLGLVLSLLAALVAWANAFAKKDGAQ